MDLSAVFKAILLPREGRSAQDMYRLRPGDQLTGRVLRLESEGEAWIDFGNFRARAQTQLPVQPGQVLQLKVVATGQPLHLQIIWPSSSTEQTPLALMNPAGVLDSGGQQRFMQHIDHLLAATTQASGSQEQLLHHTTGPDPRPGNEGLRQALTQIRSIFEQLTMNRSSRQIAAWLREAVEERDCFFEKKLAEVIISKPETTESDKLNMLLTRHIKPQLLLLKSVLGDAAGRLENAASLSADDTRFFRRTVDRLLTHIDQQQERIVQRHGSGDPMQVVTHWLPLKDQSQPLKLKIYYPRKKAGHDDQRYSRIAMLLQMDRLGMVRVDLCLMGRGLRIDFFLQNETVQKEIDAQSHSIQDALSTYFNPVQVITHINEQKIMRFDQEDREAVSAGRIDIVA